MRRFVGVLIAVSSVACGGSSRSGVGPADVQQYAALAQDISTAAGTYSSAANAAGDVAACQAGHRAYALQVAPMVERMRGMSGGMDEQMGMMGKAADADMGCGADAMRAELAHHDAVACTSTSMGTNHAEASRHAGAMEDWAAHQRARAEETGGMMGMGGMGQGGATARTCHRNADGTFTLSP